MPLNYRLLDPTEWPTVEPFFKEHGVSLPHPTMAQIAIAEDGDQIVGFLVRQLFWHIEPLSIAPEYRGKVNFLRLAQQLNLEGAYVFADPNNSNERMCELGGMTKLPFHVWHKNKR